MALRRRGRHGSAAALVESSSRYELMRRLRQAARDLARGGDGLERLPMELRAEVVQWRQRLRSEQWSPSEEEWLMGLTALACLAAASK